MKIELDSGEANVVKETLVLRIDHVETVLLNLQRKGYPRELIISHENKLTNLQSAYAKIKKASTAGTDEVD